MDEKIPQPSTWSLRPMSSAEDEPINEEEMALVNKRQEEEHNRRLDAAKKIILPPTLIDQNRAISEEYKHLITKAESSSCLSKTHYAEFWYDFFMNFNSAPQAHMFFKEHLKDCPLIDLGGGDGSMEILARESGSPLYINVDKYAIDINSERKKDNIHILNIKKDILEFVAQLNNNSASFVLNGIDDWIIDDYDYHHALAQELERAVKPNGIIFGVNSQVDNIFHKKIEDKKTLLIMKTIDLHIPGDLFVYQKI